MNNELRISILFSVIVKIDNFVVNMPSQAQKEQERGVRENVRVK
jgi:hypothetical protein